jgi:hypothetical protein
LLLLEEVEGLLVLQGQEAAAELGDIVHLFWDNFLVGHQQQKMFFSLY